MGRRNMELIPNRRLRASAFGQRKEGLKKKANQLSVLCGVEVALVVATVDGDGGGAGADVWESKEGVLACYRELDPEEAKLDDRRRALGMPVDDAGHQDGGAGVVLEGIAPLSSAAPVDDGYLLHALGSNGDAKDQAMAMWGFHPCTTANMQYDYQPFNSSNVAMNMGGYDLQMVPDMYNNGGLATDAYPYQTRHAAATMQHGYVFPCGRASASYFGMPSGYQMQQVVGSGVAKQPNLAMPSANEPCHAMVPVPAEYPTADTILNYMDTKATHGVHGSSGGTSLAVDARGNFINAPPAFSVAMSTGGGGGNFISAPPAAPSHTMGGTSDSFTPAQPHTMSYGGDMTISRRYATQSGMEQLHYFGDLENTQPNLWGN